MTNEELKIRLLEDLAGSPQLPPDPGVYQGNGVDALARVVGNVVRASLLDLERYGYLPPIKNVLIDYPRIVWSPKFQITVEFV